MVLAPWKIIWPYIWGFMALVVKNSPANAGDIRDTSLIPGSGRSCEGGHGNPLACRNQWAEEPSGLQSIGSQTVRRDWTNLACTHTCTWWFISGLSSLFRWSVCVYASTHCFDSCHFVGNFEIRKCDIGKEKSEIYNFIFFSSLFWQFGVPWDAPPPNWEFDRDFMNLCIALCRIDILHCCLPFHGHFCVISCHLFVSSLAYLIKF